MRNPIDDARAIAVTLLNLESLRTPEVIRAQVKKAVGIVQGLSEGDEEVPRYFQWERGGLTPTG